MHETYPGAFAGPRTRMQLFSVSKSVTSMLVGIALADGVIGSVKDRVTDYRPDFRRHRLRGDHPGRAARHDQRGRRRRGVGRAGQRHQALRAGRHGRRRRRRGHPRGAPPHGQPGERFNYSTFDAQILGWVLEAATGRSPRPATPPSGCGARSAPTATRTTGSPGPDPAPRSAAGSFNATARDVARLGLLMANDGVVGGRAGRPARVGPPQPRQRPAPARGRRARPERIRPLRVRQPVVDAGRAAPSTPSPAWACTASTSSSIPPPTS